MGISKLSLSPRFFKPLIRIIAVGLILSLFAVYGNGLVYASSPIVNSISINPSYVADGLVYISGASASSSISAQITDTGTGIDPASCQYTINGTNWLGMDFNAASSTCHKSGIDLGSATSTNVRAADMSSLVGTGTPLTLIIDSDPPMVDAGPALAAHAPFLYAGASSTDSGSGIAGFFWSKLSGPGNLFFSSTSSQATEIWADQDGNYSILLSVTDNVGNVGTSTLSLAWDTVIPTSNTLGDGTVDYSLASGSLAMLDFSEPLSVAGRSNVENALNSGSDKQLDFSWNATDTKVSFFSPISGTTTFANDVYAVLSDPAGNENSALLIDSSLESGQLSATSSVTINASSTQVVVVDTFQPTTITIPAGVTDATIDFDALASSTGAYIPSINIMASTSIGLISVNMPGPMYMGIASSGWDGIMNMPVVLDNSAVSVTPSPGYSAAVSSAFSIGADDIEFTFSRAVRISIPGQAGKSVGYSRGGSFFEIAVACNNDDQVSADNQLASSSMECKIDSGADLILWTRHFTSFITYSQTAIPGASGGGGGSGGGSSGGGGGVIYKTPCASVTYGGWKECINGFQFRDLVELHPENCVLTQDQQDARMRSCSINIPGTGTGGTGTEGGGGAVNMPSMLWRNAVNQKIYLLRGGSKFSIPSLEVLRKYFQGWPITNVLPSELGPYNEMDLHAEGSLMRSPDWNIYWVRLGAKYPIKNLEVLRESFMGREIINTTDEKLNGYIAGVFFPENTLLRVDNRRIFVIKSGLISYITDLMELAREYPGKRITDVPVPYIEAYLPAR